MKFNKKRLIYVLPLLFILMLYGCYSVRTARQTENLDRMFNILFSGETLGTADQLRMDSFSRDDLLTHMEFWTGGRQQAAFLILEFNGFDFSESREKEESESSDRRVSRSNPDESELLLIAAAEDFHMRDYEAAEKAYREYWILTIQNTDTLPAPSVLLDIRNSVLKTDTALSWINLLNEWKGFEASGFGGSFFLAGCFENSENTDDALHWYKESILRSDDWKEIRRSQWYIIRLLSREYPEQLPVFLDQTGIIRNEGAYFDDVLDEYYSTLVRYRQWGDLLTLIPALVDAGLRDSASQGYFLLEKAQKAGYLSQDALDSLPGRYSSDPRGYFALRSSPQNWPESGEGSRIEPNPESAVQNSFSTDLDELYSLLLSAGYEEEALRRLDEKKEALSMETLIRFCRYLEEKGDLYELIRFAGYWFYRLPSELGMALLPWVFPGAERYVLPDNNVPEELILGIIRRESAFNEGILSRVGAGGLMQLMPSTAEELTRKYSLEDRDIMNPDDNIELGTLYLNWLLERPWTDSYVDVLAAYNGGGGNLRSWKRRFPSSDPDLFIQSIPFRETRDYVRKVIVAAATYRYLETGLPPGEWLEQFYQPF